MAAGVSALIRDGGLVVGGNLAVLMFVLEFLDAHVPRGLAVASMKSSMWRSCFRAYSRMARRWLLTSSPMRC